MEDYQHWTNERTAIFQLFSTTNDRRLSQLSKTLRTMEDYHNLAKRWTDERRGPTNRHVR